MLCPRFTGAAIRKVCESHGIPLHVRWGARKLESWVPQKTKHDDVVVTIWGDHLYLISESNAKQAVANEAAAKFDIADWCLAPIQQGGRKAPGLSEWELYTRLMPGHFYSRDLQAVRTQCTTSMSVHWRRKTE